MKERSLNILQVISSLKYVSGAVRTLYLLSIGLAKKGNNVTVVSYVEEEGIVADWLRSKGIDVQFLGKKSPCLSRFERYKAIFKLRKLLKKKKIDVIHAHNSDADIFCAMASLFNRRLKKVVTIHSSSYVVWSKSKRFLYQKIIFPVIDYFVCVSSKLKDEVVHSHQFLTPKVSVIYNAPAPEFFAPESKEHREAIRDKFKISKDVFLIGIIGNYSKIKGIEVLLTAFNKISEIPFRAIFVGAYYDDHFESLNAISKEGENESKVIFAGHQEDIPQILDSIDLFVLPSLTEADPWVLSEAMAKGKVVVATRVGGIPEKVTDGKNGFLVPPNDSQSLADAIKYVYENRSEAVKIGCEARSSIKKHYSYESMIEQYLRVYQLK